MLISQIEIGNFRKLAAARIDLSQKKTVFVGANNSGKTSAMTALRRFLVAPTEFSTIDFTLSNWSKINAFGDAWEAGEDLPTQAEATPTAFETLLPHMDVWLDVKDGEMHYVKPLIPTLDWEKGLLGVRLRFEPDDFGAMRQEYCNVRKKNADTLKAASEQGQNIDVVLWPRDLMDFLERRLGRFFRIKTYLLDPAKLVDAVDGIARPQLLGSTAEPLERNPLDGLIRVNEISAQRGLGQQVASRIGKDDASDQVESRAGRKLSGQLRSYYDRHLDPTDAPEADDLKALQALSSARTAFDQRLSSCFSNALKELEYLGYPGVTDPKLTIATNIRLQDGLNHASAVQYHIPTSDSATGQRLPEDSNGLGYQNLVSMVFALMSFRDGWMKVGKANQTSSTSFPAPLHLVLVEEPEAHLHAQVQQVFMKHAYDVLRNHTDLGANGKLTTQLVVSTHSSHIAHSSDFSSLRYFRRIPASAALTVPTACVVNLKSVFGEGDETGRFVARYLKATHCDLFFADAAVLIEGSAERILIPHFVETRPEFQYLRRCYLSWLEIGGSHAHRLRGLIEHLGLTTLIVTDIDVKDAEGKISVPQRNTGQETRNETIRTWTPEKKSLDVLIDLEEAKKALDYPGGFSVRSAYQTPVKASIKWKDENENGNEKEESGEAISYTFEDSIFFKNISFFKDREGTGLAGRYRKDLDEAKSFASLVDKVRASIKASQKAEFALDLLYSSDIDKLQVPDYISHGISWLISQLEVKEETFAPKSKAAS